MVTKRASKTATPRKRAAQPLAPKQAVAKQAGASPAKPAAPKRSRAASPRTDESTPTTDVPVKRFPDAAEPGSPFETPPGRFPAE